MIKKKMIYRHNWNKKMISKKNINQIRNLKMLLNHKKNKMKAKIRNMKKCPNMKKYQNQNRNQKMMNKIEMYFDH